MDSALLGGIIGAGGALVVGFGGAVVSNFPAWRLEKRQAKKEARDEVRRLMSNLVTAAIEGALQWRHRTPKVNAEAAVDILKLRSQLNFVIRPRDVDIRSYIEEATAVIVSASPHMVEESRLAVASTLAERLPSWYRGEIKKKQLREDTKNLVELRHTMSDAKAASGTPATKDAFPGPSAP